MTLPDEEALVGTIVTTVSAFLDAVLQDEAAEVAAALTDQSMQHAGLSVFGTGAIGVALGLAAKPHQIGLTSVEAGDGVAVAEVRGRSEAGDDVSACTVLLAQEGDTWKVDDIWPVPADCEFDPDIILEPTVLFYNGQAQLAVAADANLDPVEAVLVPGLQGAELGLHLVEHGVTLWRAFVEVGQVTGEPAAWAAGAHLAVLAISAGNPDPQQVAQRYNVPVEAVAARFMEIAERLGFDRAAEDEPAPAPPTGLVDLTGRPIPPTGSKGPNSRGGIILPGG